MSNNYTVLYGKYQRALVTIRELTQEKENIEKSLTEKEDSFNITKKKISYLCASIMKKDRAPKNEDEKAWFRMSINEQIDKAQDSLERYFPSIEKTIKEVIKKNAERTEEKNKLQAELEKEKRKHEKDIQEIIKQKDSIIDELRKQLKTGRIDESKIEKIIAERTKKMETIDIPLEKSLGFETEESDNIQQHAKNTITAMYEDGERVITAAPGPTVEIDEETKKSLKNDVKEIADKRSKQIDAFVKTLNDTQKLIIRAIGETGLSELNPIIDVVNNQYGKEEKDISPSSVRLAAHGLTEELKDFDDMPVIKVTKVPIPGSPNFHVYELTKLGVDCFSFLYGKDAVESIAESIRKQHTTLEHGYGIQRTAELIKTHPYTKSLTDSDVVYITRDKGNTIKTGQRKSYIPDIVLKYKDKEKKPKQQFIEYETGKCSVTDFADKCIKIACITKYVNVIVPNNQAKTNTLEKINKFKKMAKEDPSILQTIPKERKEIVFRISTFLELKDSLKENDNKKLWFYETVFSLPQQT